MVPKQLRDHLGLSTGVVEVEVVVDGAALRVEPVAQGSVTEEGGRLVVAAVGATLDDAAVRSLRDAAQR